MSRPLTPPAIGSRWKSRTNDIWTVTVVANRHRLDPTMFPVTVIYTNQRGETESRPLSRWVNSVTPYTPPAVGACSARRNASGSFYCPACGTSWDADDTPPDCRRSPG